MFNKLIACVFVLSALSAAHGLSCLDRQGNPVAWFSFIKFPGNLTANAPRYAYIDANSGNKYETIRGALCDHEDEALPKTFDAINKLSVMYANKLLYSDQPPNAKYNPGGGHAKGVLAFDNQTQTGVYIMHSFPQYPNISTTIDGHILHNTPSNTQKFGQNAYCISLDQENFQHILRNLPIKQPNVYYSSGLFKYMKFNSKEKYAISQFNLLNGDDQWFLSKNSKYAGFLYEDIISPYFQTSLAVESWGRPYQTPRCAPHLPYSSHNIVKIALNDEDSWDHRMDHSKWTVTMGDDGVKLACLCDMNRMDSQMSRGGSCMCSRNQNLYQALRSVIVVTDGCEQSVIA